MEENTQIEQSLDLDEGQLQAINGGIGSEETLKAIAHHQAQASHWSDVHAQKLRERSPEGPEFAQAALSLAAEHANIAEGLQKSHEQFQQLVASTPSKPKSNLLNCFGCFR